MALKQDLLKVEEVLDSINYSNRDVDEVNILRDNVSIPIGGKCYTVADIEKGPRMTVNYTSSNPTIGSINNNGEVIGVSTGDTQITAKCGPMSDTTDVNVSVTGIHDHSAIKAQDRTIDEIAIINPRETLEVGDEYALYAVGISNNLVPKYDIGYYNPIKFTSSDPSVAGIMYGTLMAHKEGTCTITATALSGSASASFNLTVIPAQTVPKVSLEETYTPTIDNAGETDVTETIAEAFTYASQHGYKKISFPNGSYKINADSRPNNAAILIPGDIVIDFNGAILYMQEGTMTTRGYTLFSLSGKKNVWIENMSIYGENYERETDIRKEADRFFSIDMRCENIHFENCHFGWSPGVNVGITHSWNFPGECAWLRLADVEAGGIDSNGNNIEQAGAFRSARFMGGYTEMGTQTGAGYTIPGDGWTCGSFLGYRPVYVRSRLYDISFYGENYVFLYQKRNCYMYQWYPFDTNYPHPKYYKIAFYQEEAPTDEDTNPYGGVFWLTDVKTPIDVYFKNCRIERARRVGISPQGGTHVVIDNCLFINNGADDPFSHLDWEDGRQCSQGHIVRNSKFIREPSWSKFYAHGQIINGYCRNITFHDNYTENCLFSTWNESTMARTFNNVFNGGGIRIDGKQDSIFAGNVSTATPNIIHNTVGDTETMAFDNEVIDKIKD